MTTPPPIPGAVHQTRWYYADADSQPQGPLSRQELAHLAAEGTITPDTFVIEEGGNEWSAYRKIPPLIPSAAVPPPLPPASSIPFAYSSAALPPGTARASSSGLKRWLLFFGVNIAVVLTIGFLVNLFGVNSYLEADGLNLGALCIYSLVIGFGGSFFSLLISKWMAIHIYDITVVKKPQNETQRWLLDTLASHARAASIPTPELGVYESTEVNAFATGPRRSNSIVALSTALLDQCTPEEIEAIMGHEVGHIAAGDMVTMTLLQGVLNTFVVFFSRLLGYLASLAVEKEKASRWVQILTTLGCQIILGLVASLILMAYSRRREFGADAFSATIRGKEAMIHALARLQSISLETCPPDTRGASMAAFKISASKKSWLDLFDTHPPIEERIAALQKL